MSAAREGEGGGLSSNQVEHTGRAWPASHSAAGHARVRAAAGEWQGRQCRLCLQPGPAALTLLHGGRGKPHVLGGGVPIHRHEGIQVGGGPHDGVGQRRGSSRVVAVGQGEAGRLDQCRGGGGGQGRQAKQQRDGGDEGGGRQSAAAGTRGTGGKAQQQGSGRQGGGRLQGRAAVTPLALPLPCTALSFPGLPPSRQPHTGPPHFQGSCWPHHTRSSSH
jgi:hypothetical protein